MRVELGRGAVDLIRRSGEEAVTVDLTLEFGGGGALKRAVAFPGAGAESAGYRRLRVGEIDVYWRQRLVVEGRDAELTGKVAPRRLRLESKGSTLIADPHYA